MEALNESRRERKKRATRETIAATARKLFAERGFDAVTVSEVAAAADVSEKTVYNHFPTKEDLAFVGRQQLLEALLKRIAQRPSGCSVLDVFRASTEQMIGNLAEGNEEALAMRQIILASPALQERLMTGWEQEAAALTAAIAKAAGAADDDIIPTVVGRTLLWTHRATFRAALTGLLAGKDPEQLAAQLQLAAGRAYDLLAGGLGEYGKRS